MPLRGLFNVAFVDNVQSMMRDSACENPTAISILVSQLSVRKGRFFCPSALGPCSGLATGLLRDSAPPQLLKTSGVFCRILANTRVRTSH